MINLQSEIRRLSEFAEQEENEIVKRHLQACANILHAADSFLDVKIEKNETCLGFQLSDVTNDKDTDLLKKLGFNPHKKSAVPNKKILYVCQDGVRIIFARNAYNEHYSNDGPFVGKNQDEINLINESDFIVVARYEKGSDKDADYVDGAAFDIRSVKLAINANNQIEFLQSSQNATIFVPQSGDWIKLLNLDKKE